MLVRHPVKKLCTVFWNQLCQTRARSVHRWKFRARDTKYEIKILTKSASLTVGDLI